MTAVLENKVEVVLIHQRLFHRYHVRVLFEREKGRLLSHNAFSFPCLLNVHFRQSLYGYIFLGQFTLSEEYRPKSSITDLLKNLEVLDRGFLILWSPLTPHTMGGISLFTAPVGNITFLTFQLYFSIGFYHTCFNTTIRNNKN